MIIKNAMMGIMVLLLSLAGGAVDAVTQINSNTSVPSGLPTMSLIQGIRGM